MMRFRRIVQFIRKWREAGIYEFKISTTRDSIIIFFVDKDKKLEDRIHIKY